jgi:hypothetical protein
VFKNFFYLLLEFFSCDQPIETRAAVRVGRNVVFAMAVGCEPKPNCGHAAVKASVSKFVDIISILTFGRKDMGDGGIAETFNCERTKKCYQFVWISEITRVSCRKRGPKVFV